MGNLKLILAATGAAALLATGALQFASTISAAPAAETTAIPETAAEHAAEADKYEQEALALDQKGTAPRRNGQGVPGALQRRGKQGTMLLSLVAHCKRLAKIYAEAAAEARETAKSHRDMAKAI